jgi:hypothetical protein
MEQYPHWKPILFFLQITKFLAVQAQWTSLAGIRLETLSRLESGKNKPNLCGEGYHLLRRLVQ